VTLSPFRTDIAAVWALTKRDLVRFSRDRSQISGALGRPAIWLVLFGSGLHRPMGASMAQGVDYKQFVYSGAITMTILFGGMFQGVTIVWDREFGMLREVLVAPVSRAAIALGKTLGGAAVTVVQGLVAAVFAPLVGVSIGWVAAAKLLGAMGVLSLGVTALGVAVGSRMKTFEGFGVISNFVILPLYFLSGSVFPSEGLPGWMRTLVLINPITYGVDMMRAAIDQPHAFPAALDATLLGAFALVMCGGAFAAFRRDSH
jgi:ABC-2 type transport system permease protein